MEIEIIINDNIQILFEYGNGIYKSDKDLLNIKFFSYLYNINDDDFKSLKNGEFFIKKINNRYFKIDKHVYEQISFM